MAKKITNKTWEEALELKKEIHMLYDKLYDLKDKYESISNHILRSHKTAIEKYQWHFVSSGTSYRTMNMEIHAINKISINGRNNKAKKRIAKKIIVVNN